MTDLLEPLVTKNAVIPRQRKTKTAIATRNDAPVVVDGPGSLLSAIIVLAKDQSVDVAKLGALVSMQERLEEHQAKIEFSRALTRLAGKMPRVKKNGTVDLGPGKGNYAFAKWEDMDRVIRPLMDAEGFTLSFDTQPRTEAGGGMIITGELLHADGHSKTASISLALDTGPGRNNLQAMGSTLSYGKRYAAEMLLNIVREGADDDGIKGGAEFIGPGQIAKIRELLAETNTKEVRFAEMIGVAEIEDIKVSEFAIAVNLLNAKKAAAK